LELAQYRELAAFAQFASDLDKATRDQLERGGRLTELLKQGQYSPISLSVQVASIWAGTNGHLDKVAVSRVREWESGFARYLRSDQKDLLEEIETKMALDDDLLKKLEKAVRAFNRQFGVEGAEAEPAKDAAEEKPKAEEEKPAAEDKKESKAPAAAEERRRNQERRSAERRSGTTSAGGQTRERRSAERRTEPRRAT